MNVLKIAAFAHDGTGGNPAGVVIGDKMPTEQQMLEVAKQVGYSETAFLHPLNDGWRIRYFAPEIEIPFCGHATIASGAVLGDRLGEGTYRLLLNDGEISVEVSKAAGDRYAVALQSPRTSSAVAPEDFVESVLSQFNFGAADIDPEFPVRFASAGAKHLIFVLRERQTLADMKYKFDATKALMLKEGLATINLVWPESDELFHSRNPFASGGVYEDPATGAAAAALAGYLRDIAWQGKENFEIIQGQDMGCASRLLVAFTPEPGGSIRVAGETRYIE